MQHVTIGELTNELLPYCNLVELKMRGETPYLRALLANHNGFTEAYLYIVQIAPHRYSICETNDEFYSRYLPTESSYEPFILERELIDRMWGNRKHNHEEDDRIVKDLSYIEFLGEFYRILSYYRIINITNERLDISIRDIQFSTFRLTRALGALGDNSTVIDLIKTIKDSSKEFKLEGIRDKDLPELLQKFNQIGITLDIRDKVIQAFNFDRVTKKPKIYRSGNDSRFDRY